MRQSPRLLGNTAGRNSGSGHAEPTIPGSLPPTTPRHSKTGADLDSLVIALEEEWRLGLRVRGPLWSPRESKGSTSEKVYGQIQRLFFSAEPALDAALDNFRETALGFAHSKRLELLHGILKSKTQSPISRTGTPL
jgi:hypothetical protein